MIYSLYILCLTFKKIFNHKVWFGCYAIFPTNHSISIFNYQALSIHVMWNRERVLTMDLNVNFLVNFTSLLFLLITKLLLRQKIFSYCMIQSAILWRIVLQRSRNMYLDTISISNGRKEMDKIVNLNFNITLYKSTCMTQWKNE